MTSSLVGSEMCIRDSVPSTRMQPLQGAEGTGATRSSSTRSTCTRCHRTPVSYTHLTLPTICSV
eukprot:5685068-Prorocentrum_lima.AAC.1